MWLKFRNEAYSSKCNRNVISQNFHTFQWSSNIAVLKNIFSMYIPVMVLDSKGTLYRCTGVHIQKPKLNIALFLFNFTLQTNILWLSFSIAVLHEDNRPKTFHNYYTTTPPRWGWMGTCFPRKFSKSGAQSLVLVIWCWTGTTAVTGLSRSCSDSTAVCHF